MYAAPNGVRVAPEFLGCGLADDGHKGGAGTVGIREVAAALRRDVHGFEKSGADDAPIKRHLGANRQGRLADRLHRSSGAVCLIERNATGKPCAAHTRDSLQRLKQVAIKQRSFAVGGRIFRCGWSELESDHPMRLKTNIDLLEVYQGLNQQSSPNQQSGGKGKLNRGQAIAESGAHLAGGTASGLFKHVVEISLR